MKTVFNTSWRSSADLLCSGQKTCVAEETFSVAASALKGPSENTAPLTSRTQLSLFHTCNANADARVVSMRSTIILRNASFDADANARISKVFDNFCVLRCDLYACIRGGHITLRLRLCLCLRLRCKCETGITVLANFLANCLHNTVKEFNI